jgi:hypothetical protein
MAGWGLSKKGICFWQWTAWDGVRRLHLVHIPRVGAIMLHHVTLPDHQYMHQHLNTFLSIVLKGSYVEETPSGKRNIRWFNFKRAPSHHRIDAVSEGGFVSILFSTLKDLPP